MCFLQATSYFPRSLSRPQVGILCLSPQFKLFPQDREGAMVAFSMASWSEVWGNEHSWSTGHLRCISEAVFRCQPATRLVFTTTQHQPKLGAPAGVSHTNQAPSLGFLSILLESELSYSSNRKPGSICQGLKSCQEWYIFSKKLLLDEKLSLLQTQLHCSLVFWYVEWGWYLLSLTHKDKMSWHIWKSRECCMPSPQRLEGDLARLVSTVKRKASLKGVKCNLKQRWKGLWKVLSMWLT
jgi:hypothetical protein